MLDKLTGADFTPLLNQTFQLKLQSEESFSAELIDITELGRKPEEDDSIKRQAFSAIFRINDDLYFPQQICRLEHETLGGLDLFLVPLGPDKVGMRYEAMFT